MSLLSLRRSRLKAFFLGVLCTLIIAAGAGGYAWHRLASTPDFSLVDPLGGNIFPSALLSVATTQAQPIATMGAHPLGNAKNPFAIRLTAARDRERIRITLEETPFFARSVSEFELPAQGTEYTVYPDIIWRYDRLRANSETSPISVVASVRRDGREAGQQVRTYSVRALSECLYGYIEQSATRRVYRPTYLFFAAYVDEDNRLIDEVLREALNTRFVRRFQGYQGGTAASVDQQVFALWYVLQQRNFRYSSIANSSLSSNVVFSQRVRTFAQALRSSQVNCVDGSVLFASLLRAINITPTLIKTPGHMYVGYRKEQGSPDLTFLETTMIGDIDLDEYFPAERLDSALTGMSRKAASRLTFEKAKEYAAKNYARSAAALRAGKTGYMQLEVSKQVRKAIQPLTE